MSALVVTIQILLGDSVQAEFSQKIPIPELIPPIPSIPSFTIPEVPSLDLDLDFPEGISAPAIPSFGISIPTPSIPSISIPEVPSIDIGLDFPEGIPAPAIPSFEISIPTPSIPLPSIPEIPDAPTIDSFEIPFAFSFAGLIPKIEISSTIE